jgi:hypothetical protein
VDGELEDGVVAGSGGALRLDARRRCLVYAEGDGDPVEVAVTEAELRTWMTVLLLASPGVADGDTAIGRGARQVLESCRAHGGRGEDPFTPLRAHLARSAAVRGPDEVEAASSRPTGPQVSARKGSAG